MMCMRSNLIYRLTSVDKMQHLVTHFPTACQHLSNLVCAIFFPLFIRTHRHLVDLFKVCSLNALVIIIFMPIIYNNVITNLYAPCVLSTIILYFMGYSIVKSRVDVRTHIHFFKEWNNAVGWLHSIFLNENN